MKLSMMINYVGDFPASAQQVVELEKVGLDIVWVAEAYSFDSISQDRKSTRLNSSHSQQSRMPSSA